MASSQLKIKTVTRQNLYYGKYNYRVCIRSGNLAFIQYCKNIDEYNDRLEHEHVAYLDRQDKNNNATKIYYYYSRFYDPCDIDLPLAAFLIDLRNKYYKNRVITTRTEGNSFCIYTSEYTIVKDLLEFTKKASALQAEKSPDGIKYFKRTPPANYRVYMANRRAYESFKDDMNSYLSRTPDMVPNSTFTKFLNRPTRYSPHLWDGYYLDYNDDRNLMMLHLMFPGLLGKTYKLEKKTD